MSEGVYIYEHINYGGYEIFLTEGNYNMHNLIGRGFRNDDISSIRIIGNYEVILYEHINFGGRTYTTRSNLHNFVNIGWNDIVTSIRVIKLNVEEEVEEEVEVEETNTENSIFSKINGSIVTITSIYGNMASNGTGFFIKYNNKLYIITAAHVILNNNRDDRPDTILASVVNINGTNDKKAFVCKTIGVAAYADIAVLEVENQSINTNHKYLNFGESRKLNPGDNCYIVGYALGIDELSISDGVIRDNKYVIGNIMESMCSAVISYDGNSGGPVLNKFGEIIGIVSYGFTGIEGFTWGCSQYIMEGIVKKIIDTNTNFIGKNINATIRAVNAVDLYVLNILDKELKGYIVQETNDSKLIKNDIIISIENIVLGVYDGQYPPTKSIYFNTNNTLICTILRNNEIITESIDLYMLDVNKDIFLGDSSANNIKKIGPITRSF